MDRSFAVKKQTILVGLGLLLLADLGLAGYSWQTSTALRTPMAQLDLDSRKLTLLAADIDHAEKIRHDLPATVADCDKFDASLLPAGTSDSAITAELDAQAKKSGLQIHSLSFKYKELLARPLTEVELDVLVAGDYSNIVKFMNGVQRSQTFYIVESLSLQEEGQSSPGKLRIALHLKTYFRKTA